MPDEIVAPVATSTTEESPVSTPVEAGGNEVPASGKQSVETPTQTPFDYDWWKKDKRFGRVWKNEKDVFKSAYEADQLIEKQYKPLRAQADAFQKMFEGYGFKADINEIKQALDELKSFKDPNNPDVANGRYFNQFFGNPEYKDKIIEFFEGMRKSEIRKQFGEGVSDEIVKEILENRKYREEQERREKDRQQSERVGQMTKQIDEGWKLVEQEAKSIGLPINESMRQSVLDACEKEGIDPRLVYYKFQQMYRDDILKHQRAKIQADFNKTRERQHRSGVIPASPKPSSAVKPQGKPDLLSRVKSAVGLST